MQGEIRLRIGRGKYGVYGSYKWYGVFCLAATLLSLFFFLPPMEAASSPPAVADLTRFPQDASAYLPEDPDAPIIDMESQRASAGEYLRNHYAPWYNTDLSYLELSMDKVLEFHSNMAKKRYFVAGGSPFPAASMKKIMDNGRIDPNAAPRPAVAVADADVRVLPTSTPLYPSAASACGERGLLKLDSMQNSALKPAEPLAVYAMSGDGAWYFISTGTVVGWVRSNKAAFVGDVFIKEYVNAKHRVVARDNLAVRGNKGEALAVAKMGAVIPSDGEALLLPRRGVGGVAEIVRFTPEKGAAPAFPVAFTPRNAALAIGQIAGEQYGWGGANGLRDCSAMTRDYFSVFGVWLPRNSGDQAKAGAALPLKNLDAGKRIETIIASAVPFATLIHMPGHIMLYIGAYDFEPAVLHNVWGVRRYVGGGKVGRAVIGRTAVTGLRAGAEIQNRPKSSLFIDNVTSLVFPVTGVR